MKTVPKHSPGVAIAAVASGQYSTQNLESLRRNRLSFSPSDLQELQHLWRILQAGQRESREWKAAYSEMIEKGWYLEIAGNQMEFDEVLSRNVGGLLNTSNLATAEQKESNRAAGQKGSRGNQNRSAAKKLSRRSLGAAKEKRPQRTVDVQVVVPAAEAGTERITARPCDKPTGAKSRGISQHNTDLQHWTERINDQVARSAQDLVELGRLFLQAKAELKHGDWQKLFESGKVGFSLRSAQRLMQIAKNEALSKATNSSLLPPSSDALTTLARVQAHLLQNGIDSGEVYPGMTLAEVKEFVLGQEPKAKQKGTDAFDYQTTLKKLAGYIQKTLTQVPNEKVNEILNDLIKELGIWGIPTR